TGSITGASLAATQVAVATGSSAITSYAGFTTDSSGNVTAASLTVSSPNPGIAYLGQGTTPQSTGTTAIGLTDPTSVTSYNLVFPSAASAGTDAASGNFYLKLVSSQNQTGCTATATELCGYFETAISLSSTAGDITGILQPVNGGTGASSLTIYDVLTGNGTSAVNLVAPIAGGVLSSSSASAYPTFSATPTLGNLTTTTGTLTLASGASAGAITLSPGTNSNTFSLTLPTGVGTNGQCLQSSGSGTTAMTWGSCGGAVAWSGLTAPTTSLSMNMYQVVGTSFPTTFTYGNATGAATNMFSITDTASNSGTGALLYAGTAASSLAIAFQAQIQGNDIIKAIAPTSSSQQLILGACYTSSSPATGSDGARQVTCSSSNGTGIARFQSGSASGYNNTVVQSQAQSAGSSAWKLFSGRQGVNADGSIGSGTEVFSVLGTGAINTTAAGAVSQAAVTVSGAPYTAGSATTNFPLVYLNDGSGPTTFSTTGTEFGINAPSGFTGNMLDFHVNGGASVAALSYTGLYTGRFAAGSTVHGVLVSEGTAAAAVATALGAANMPLIGQTSADPIFSTIAYPTSLTQGGLLYASTTVAIAGGGALTQYGVVVAGAVGSAPQSTAAGAANMPLVGAGAANPAFSTIGWLASATQWGIPYMSTATQMSTTAALTGNCLIKAGSTAAPSCSTFSDNATLVTGTEPLTLTPAARTSGALSYFIVNAPTDTGITTTAESVGVNFVGATRTWAAGTVATQRENLFQHPTYATGTFTNAATLAIDGPPAGGTFTNGPYALWVQSGPSWFQATTNQFVTGTGSNLTTLNFPVPSGAVTLTFPITTEYIVGANSDTTTTHLLH